MTYFSGTIICFLVPIDIFFDCDNNHEVHAGTGNFEVDFNLGRIIGGKTISFAFVSSIVFSFVDYCMRYMVITIFQ